MGLRWSEGKTRWLGRSMNPKWMRMFNIEWWVRIVNNRKEKMIEAFLHEDYNNFKQRECVEDINRSNYFIFLLIKHTLYCLQSSRYSSNDITWPVWLPPRGNSVELNTSPYKEDSSVTSRNVPALSVPPFSTASSSSSYDDDDDDDGVHSRVGVGLLSVAGVGVVVSCTKSSRDVWVITATRSW